MNNKFSKVLNAIMPLLLILLAGILAFNHHHQNVENKFLVECQNFSEQVSAHQFANLEYQVNVFDSDNEHEDLIMVVDIFNYEMASEEIVTEMLDTFSEEFMHYEFKGFDVEELRIDIFDSNKEDEDSIQGIGVATRVIEK